MVTLNVFPHFSGYFAWSFTPAQPAYSKRHRYRGCMSETSQTLDSTQRVPFAVVWVFIGGAIGSLLRALLMFGENMLLSSTLALLAINVLGSFALGLLTGWLSARASTPRLSRLQLLVGTGLLGGFTSYSALTLLTSQFLLVAPGVALLYGLGSVVLGVAMAWLGLALGRQSGAVK